MILKYDWRAVRATSDRRGGEGNLEGKARSTDVTEEEAREMAYHYIRSPDRDAATRATVSTSGNGHRRSGCGASRVVTRENRGRQARRAC